MDECDTDTKEAAHTEALQEHSTDEQPCRPEPTMVPLVREPLHKKPKSNFNRARSASTSDILEREDSSADLSQECVEDKLRANSSEIASPAFASSLPPPTSSLPVSIGSVTKPRSNTEGASLDDEGPVSRAGQPNGQPVVMSKAELKRAKRSKGKKKQLAHTFFKGVRLSSKASPSQSDSDRIEESPGPTKSSSMHNFGTPKSGTLPKSGMSNTLKRLVKKRSKDKTDSLSLRRSLRSGSEKSWHGESLSPDDRGFLDSIEHFSKDASRTMQLKGVPSDWLLCPLVPSHS